MKKIIALLLFVPVVAFAQQDTILSGHYKFIQPQSVHKSNMSIAILLEGKVHDFEWVQLSANTIPSPTKKIKQQVPNNQERLIISKSGILNIQFNDSTFALSPGSVAVLMPGEKYSFSTTQPCTFYYMKYRSKQPTDVERGKNSGGSFVKLWDNIPFKPNSIGGGGRNYFNKSTAMQKRFEMHVTTLKEGVRSHDPHTHRAEEIVLMIEGNTEMQIGEKFYRGTTADFYYLGSNVLHAIKNVDTKPVMYFAFQFE